MSRHRTAVAAASVIVVGLSTVAMAPAVAGDGEVIREGACSAGADWKLKAKARDGRIEVEGEVDSGVNGQRWKWRILHDGDVSARGKATTTGRSGSFSVERKVVNAAGNDRIAWRARSLGGGQTCRGGLTF